jgi:hypothetical protein
MKLYFTIPVLEISPSPPPSAPSPSMLKGRGGREGEGGGGREKEKTHLTIGEAWREGERVLDLVGGRGVFEL